MAIKLYEHQIKAIRNMKNGCILNGGVGSGKSITALSYYYLLQGGNPDTLNGGSYKFMQGPKDLYIITTARKRDDKEWERELSPFLLSTDRDLNRDAYKNKVVVDSWNNIQKYKTVTNSFFIFDEQRVVGYGAWTKSFLKITRNNEWILLSATPGDVWADYIPVFVANGFYRNKTEFNESHVIWDPYSKFPRIKQYYNTERLVRLRNKILIDMDFRRKTIRNEEDIYVGYDKATYKDLMREHWNPFTDKPVKTASELCYALRKVVNSSEERQTALLEILEKHPRAIIFYNFDYELDILKTITYGEDVGQAEWNGHKHQEIPNSQKWVYFVQYTAGAEGWNCITTDTIIFYSQNYSYKILEQAMGRIDRLNTPYTNLYYYHIKSRSGIDLAISKALLEKRKFNEGRWVGKTK